ncbi:MAG: hypothetical protein HZB50_18030 [Chloroflexi bacterium]|nr:hypothetical protein [Chloroflexota bacterium]
MRKLGIVILTVFIVAACSTTNTQPSNQTSTPTVEPLVLTTPRTTSAPTKTPTASLPEPSPTSDSIKTGYQAGIVLDPALKNEETPIISAWMGYAISRTEWIQANVSTDEIVQRGYERTFEEEVSARSTLAILWKELRGPDTSLKNPYLDDLLKVYEAGYIKEYTWIFLASSDWLQPDGLLLEEFSAWSKKNLINHSPETHADVEITVTP